MGHQEIEIDSRDFYVDNETIGRVIDDISRHLPEIACGEPSAMEREVGRGPQQQRQTMADTVGRPDQRNRRTTAPAAAVQEPKYRDAAELVESCEPKIDDRPDMCALSYPQIREKLLMLLDADGFFDSPRGIYETVQQLRKNGWQATSLDVTKTLVQLAACRKITKISSDCAPPTYVSPFVVKSSPMGSPITAV